MGRLSLDRTWNRRRIDILIPGWGEIEVYVVRWDEGHVRLAFTAPDEIAIVRHEIREDI